MHNRSGLDAQPRKRIDKDRLISLAWASPWLVFTVPYFYNALHDFSLRSLGFVALGLVFVLVYLGCWLLNPTVPLQPVFPRRLILCLSLLSALQILLTLAVSAESIFFVTYVAASFFLLTPAGRVQWAFGSTLAIFILEVAIIYWLAPHSLTPHATAQIFLYSAISVGASVFVFCLARSSIAHENRQELDLQTQAVQVAQEERQRMAADLHDQLGQTLTSINTCAQLSKRLSETGQAEKSRAVLENIAVLSREALAQMRKVVRSRQILTIAEELTKARQLLSLAGTNFRLKVQAEDGTWAQKWAPGKTPAYSQEVESAIAYLIKEGSANIVHHACASDCLLTLSPSRVILENNQVKRPFGGRKTGASDTLSTGLKPSVGRASESGSLEAGGLVGQGQSGSIGPGGSGLKNLKIRCAGIGHLDYGQTKNGWQVSLTLTPQTLGEQK